MVNRTTILAAVVALIPVGNPMLASAQAPGRQAATPRTTNPNLYPPADYTLKVTSNSRLPELQAKYHRKVRDLLNQARIGVPDDRVRHFRTVLSPNSAPVSGWHGEIYSIAPVEEGIVVEIMIRANQGGGGGQYHLPHGALLNRLREDPIPRVLRAEERRRILRHLLKPGGGVKCPIAPASPAGVLPAPGATGSLFGTRANDGVCGTDKSLTRRTPKLLDLELTAVYARGSRSGRVDRTSLQRPTSEGPGVDAAAPARNHPGPGEVRPSDRNPG